MLQGQFEELLVCAHNGSIFSERGVLGEKLPKDLKELRNMAIELGNLLDTYIKGIICAFILAGRLPDNTSYLDDANDMMDRIPDGYD